MRRRLLCIFQLLLNTLVAAAFLPGILQGQHPAGTAPDSTGPTRPAPAPVQSSTTTVGYPAEYLQIVLPAPEVVPLPPGDRSQPIIVRIDRTWPHGSDFRYDMTVTGLEPGEYNVADFLVAIDGGPHPGLPVIDLSVRSLLEPGQVQPHQLIQYRMGRIGWYVPVLVAAGMVWMMGLLAILFWRKTRAHRPGRVKTSLTLAERIRPVILRASRGELDGRGMAELERTLTAFWRRRLRLEHLHPEALMKQLREHEEAGPLLAQLELWLHSPSASAPPDLDALLKPYRAWSGQDYERATGS